MASLAKPTAHVRRLRMLSYESRVYACMAEELSLRSDEEMATVNLIKPQWCGVTGEVPIIM